MQKKSAEPLIYVANNNISMLFLQRKNADSYINVQYNVIYMWNTRKI